MKITIGQSEIESAVKTYILSIMTLAEGANIDVDFSATRGPDGLTANINVLPPEVAEKAKEEQVVLTREPEKATGSAAEASKTTTRKPRTLTIEQKAPENATAVQEEEVATTAQAQAKEATSEQQGASADGDGQAVGGKGFPGFESEDGDSDGAASTDSGDQEEQSAVADVTKAASNEAGATTAEPSTRKSLFGGLGRPSNH